MLGPACHGPNFPPAFKEAEATIADLTLNARIKNRNLWDRVGPSGDDELDEESWKKTQKELDAGTLIELSYDESDIDWDGDRVVLRNAIRERHGGAEKDSFRNIDDCLVGKQNSTVSYRQSHRPVTLHSWSAQIRYTESRARRRLKGYTSDFGEHTARTPPALISGAWQKSSFGTLASWLKHTLTRLPNSSVALQPH